MLLIIQLNAMVGQRRMMTIPAAFIGHGSPMNTLETNTYTEQWRRFGESIPPPRAIVAISAHWYINATAVTTMAKPRTIHDFFGFPSELSEFDYPADGAPDVAQHLIDIVKPVWVGADSDSWGLDHGTWSVLAHVVPKADVPVIQLAIDASKPLDYHFDLGARLAPLMDEDILILGSGNVVHNLRAVAWNAENQGYDWALQFDGDTRDVVMNDPARITELNQHDAYELAVPTPDHFLPAVYFAGLAAATGGSVSVFNEACTMGSLSMTSYRLDVA